MPILRDAARTRRRRRSGSGASNRPARRNAESSSSAGAGEIGIPSHEIGQEVDLAARGERAKLQQSRQEIAVQAHFVYQLAEMMLRHVDFALVRDQRRPQMHIRALHVAKQEAALSEIRAPLWPQAP